jgi:hypothetical protein
LDDSSIPFHGAAGFKRILVLNLKRVMKPLIVMKLPIVLKESHETSAGIG